MSSYSLWELNMQELIQAFTTDELTAASVDAFLQGIGFDEVEITSLPMSAERRLLVYGNADYAFTSDDIHWLSAATVVVTGLCVEGLRVHVIELICDEDEYYTYFSTNRSLGLYQPDREWQDKQTILDEFAVKEGEGFNYGLVKLVQSWDVHPPF